MEQNMFEPRLKIETQLKFVKFGLKTINNTVFRTELTADQQIIVGCPTQEQLAAILASVSIKPRTPSQSLSREVSISPENKQVNWVYSTIHILHRFPTEFSVNFLKFNYPYLCNNQQSRNKETDF